MDPHGTSRPSTPHRDHSPEELESPDQPLDCSLKKRPETSDDYYSRPQSMPVRLGVPDGPLSNERVQRELWEDTERGRYEPSPQTPQPPPFLGSEPQPIKELSKKKSKPLRPHERIETLVTRKVSFPSQTCLEGTLPYTFVPQTGSFGFNSPFTSPVWPTSFLKEGFTRPAVDVGWTSDLPRMVAERSLRTVPSEIHTPFMNGLSSPNRGLSPIGLSSPNVPERQALSSPACLPSSPEDRSSQSSQNSSNSGGVTSSLDLQSPEQQSSRDAQPYLYPTQISSPGQVSSSSCSAPKRKKGQPVPESLKMTDDYRQKRNKNNEAAKRSRDKRRSNERRLTETVETLHSANQAYETKNRSLLVTVENLIQKLQILTQLLQERQIIIERMRAEAEERAREVELLRESVRNCRFCSHKVLCRD